MKDKAYIIIPLLVLEWDKEAKFSITIGWLKKTYTFNF